jgi:hypothetical protein
MPNILPSSRASGAASSPIQQIYHVPSMSECGKQSPTDVLIPHQQAIYTYTDVIIDSTI